MQIERRIQLLVDDRPEQLAPNGKVGVTGSLPSRIGRDPLRGEHSGHQIGPTTHRPVRQLISDPLGETVPDGDVARGKGWRNMAHGG